MNTEEMTRGALISLVEGRESIIYDKILNDINLFFEKYSALKRLSSSQSAMIQGILLLGSKKAIKEGLIEYKNRQLNRSSEKDKWLKKDEDVTAINYFYGMIDGLFQNYYPEIKEELFDRFRLQIDGKYDRMISQSLIRTFAYIFVIKLRMNLTYLFTWGEIPGNDSVRLIDFLKHRFSIDWAKTAKIEKIDNDKTIKVYTEKKYLSLKLNDEITNVNIEIDDGRTAKLITKTENDKLNIYNSTEGS